MATSQDLVAAGLQEHSNSHVSVGGQWGVGEDAHGDLLPRVAKNTTIYDNYCGLFRCTCSACHPS